jgi:hypothetical protein
MDSCLEEKSGETANNNGAYASAQVASSVGSDLGRSGDFSISGAWNDHRGGVVSAWRAKWAKSNWCCRNRRRDNISGG